MWVVTAAACPSQSNGPRDQRNGTGRANRDQNRLAPLSHALLGEGLGGEGLC